MPGLYGIVNAQPLTDIATLSSAMAGQLRHYPWYVENRHIDLESGLALGRVSLGFINTAEQPAYNEDLSLLAVMEGELYDYEVQRRALAVKGHTFHTKSHAELLLHGYESLGKWFFRDLRGTFAAAIWDVRKRRLILVNDHFGMKPLYYTKLPGRLLLASEIKALLADPQVSRKISPQGLAQFFTFGHFLGEETLLQDIKILPAAAWLTYDQRKDRVTSDLYWQPEWTHRISSVDVLDRLDEAFGVAIERRVGDNHRLGISLSGGLDSRTILGAIDHDRVPVTSITLGIEGSIDHRSARQLAALSNRQHHCHLLDTKFLSRFEDHLRQMVHLTDGQYLSSCIVMPTLAVYGELGIEVLLRGHAGELLHMDKAYYYSVNREALDVNSEPELENWLWRQLRVFGSEAASLFALIDPGEMEAMARDSLRASLRECAETTPLVHKIWHLFLTQWLRRETTLSLMKFGSMVEIRLPYLDHDLVDLLMAAPPELKLSDTIQAHILRRRMPAFLGVVNSNTGVRLGGGRLARFHGKAKLNILEKLGVSGYQPYHKLGRWLREELRPLVQGLLLSEQCLSRGIFNPQTVKTIVDQHLSLRQDHTDLLMALMIFETTQRQLLDADTQAHGWQRFIQEDMVANRLVSAGGPESQG